MSVKTWQRSSQQSARLMATWLFGSKSKPTESDNKLTPSGSVIESSTSSFTRKDDEAEKNGIACELKDQNKPELERDAMDVDPVEMVECWYSSDELADEDDLEEEQVFTGRLQGHRYRKLKAPKKKRLGHVQLILKARNTIV